jgi:hypothetical protein
VTRHVLLTGSNVNQRDLAGANTADELRVVDGLKGAALFEVLPRDLLNLGESRFRQLPQFEKEGAYLRGRQAVGHVQPGLLGIDQASATKHLQMVRVAQL